MMKIRGTKRKIPIEKRETKQQRSLACNRRRKTVFSKAANLCRLSGASIAVFVTSPAESNDAVYSFSGYSSAYEIADRYLNGKPPPEISNPQSKVGFLWEDPDLYHNCDDISELNILEDRLERMKADVMACLEKKQKQQLVSNSDQTPASCSGSSSQLVSDLDQNPNLSPPSFSQIASFDRNSSYSCLDQIVSSQVAAFDQNPNFSSVTGIQGESSSKCHDESFWDQFLNDVDNVFGSYSDFCNNPQANTNTEEEDCMIDIGDYLNEEEEACMIDIGDYLNEEEIQFSPITA
ncbi:unnamed protein product [Microthlaspi erraticum]|uniref:MADS-box domain-containing protein n=1 Tax=Microthlaspi erraticum TaxID=1685480 RepID=A0A6D2JKR8_9BRAS|nr:unnamed protein product [Microthlaspi erraticum]